MESVIPVPATPSLPVAGTDLYFPLRRVFCVGRNYAAHAREMGKDPEREAPFFFTKPADAVVPGGGAVAYPPETTDLHHEIELVVAIGREGASIEQSQALEHVYGYAVGIDLTRRDLQAEAKELARPWDVAKGFDQSAPCSAVHPVEKIGHPGAGRIWLAVNGAERQAGDLAELIWSVPELTAILSRYFRLMPGDLIFTGTPAGVGPLARGDKAAGGVEGIDEITIEML